MSRKFVRKSADPSQQPSWAERRKMAPHISDLSGKLELIISQVSALIEPIKVANNNFVSRQAVLKKMQDARALRYQFFPEDLFADPAWDILLELKYAEYKQIPVTVSNLRSASGVPATTGLRWISNMVDQGLLERTGDHLDGRKVFITLHSSTSLALEYYLELLLGVET